MEMVLRYGAAFDATSYTGGSALTMTMGYEMWDIVQFLLEHGANGRCKNPILSLDAFGIAAKGAGIVWKETDAVNEYLHYLCDSKSKNAEYMLPVPDEVRQNPLVPIIEMIKWRKREETGGPH